MPTIFRYRNGWRAQANIPGRPHKDFRYQDEARKWSATLEAAHEAGKAPRLGGPTQVSLAQMLDEYARCYTVAREGRQSELNRINHYLRGAGLPLLAVRACGEGQWQIVETDALSVDAAVADGWQDYLAARRAKRARTYAAIAALARRRVSTLLPGDMHDLMATMKSDGLSDSTIQKEIALLRAMFNVALHAWHWVAFSNPCAGLKLGKSAPRFVHVTREQLLRLYEAAAQCDNPYLLPLIDCAMFLTARSGSLLALRWQHIDFEQRKIFLRKTKTGPVLLDLPLRVKRVLEALARDPSGRVFPMSANAVAMAWRGVREKAGLPSLQFRDLRHLGGTHYAKYVPAHVLRDLMGHRTLYMAQVYVNLASNDRQRILDEVERQATDVPPVPQVTAATMAERKARRLNRKNADAAGANDATDFAGTATLPLPAAGGRRAVIAFPTRKKASPDRDAPTPPQRQRDAL